MAKVTNKHEAPLNIAGTDVRPGATVEIDAGALDKWAHGNAAQQWLKLGLIVVDGVVENEDEDKEKQDDPTADRTALLEEARALGLNPNANTGTEKLRKMIADKLAG